MKSCLSSSWSLPFLPNLQLLGKCSSQSRKLEFISREGKTADLWTGICQHRWGCGRTKTEIKWSYASECWGTSYPKISFPSVSRTQATKFLPSGRRLMNLTSPKGKPTDIHRGSPEMAHPNHPLWNSRNLPTELLTSFNLNLKQTSEKIPLTWKICQNK